MRHTITFVLLIKNKVLVNLINLCLAQFYLIVYFTPPLTFPPPPLLPSLTYPSHFTSPPISCFPSVANLTPRVFSCSWEDPGNEVVVFPQTPIFSYTDVGNVIKTEKYTGLWKFTNSFNYLMTSCFAALPFQARIHTGFHRFTEIGQILHNKYIFSKKLLTFKVDIWKMVWTVSKYPVWMTQKPRKGDFGELKSQKFPGGACPKTSLEVGNRSVFILDPHLLSTFLLWLLGKTQSFLLKVFMTILCHHAETIISIISNLKLKQLTVKIFG